MSDKPKALLMETGGHFYAEKSSQGWAVYKDGGTRHYSDGSRRLGWNIPVVLASEWVDETMHEELCETIAKAMNESNLFT